MTKYLLAAASLALSVASSSDARASDGLVWTGELYPSTTNFESQPSPGYNWHNTYTTVQVSNSTGYTIHLSSFVWDYVAHTATIYNPSAAIADGTSVTWWSGGGSNPNAKAVYAWCTAPLYPHVDWPTGYGFCSPNL